MVPIGAIMAAITNQQRLVRRQREEARKREEERMRRQTQNELS